MPHWAYEIPYWHCKHEDFVGKIIPLYDAGNAIIGWMIPNRASEELPTTLLLPSAWEVMELCPCSCEKIKSRYRDFIVLASVGTVELGKGNVVRRVGYG